MKRQEGAVLAVCLVFLALLTLLAVAGMESLLLHERMETNMRQSRAGFEAAEAALREAENEIERQCPAGDSAAPRPAAEVWPQVARNGADWWETHGVEADFAGALTRSPKFFLETWNGASAPAGVATPFYFRITARGAGPADAGPSVLQVVGVAICDGGQTRARRRLSWRRIL